MKVYYAHPLYLYNTPQEKRDLDTLAAIFGAENIVNPNNDDFTEKYKQNWDMEVFYQAVRDCDTFAFRATPSGAITAGVAGELAAAQKAGLAIIELPALVNRALSIDDTRIYLSEIGQR